MLQCSDFFRVTEKTKESVRQCFSKTKEEINQDIEIIKEWIKQQAHLPQGIQDDDFIEACLLRNKFRVEQTKEKLEKYYTIRGMHYDTFKDIPLELPSKFSDSVVALPQLTANFERVIIIKVNTNIDIETYDVMKFFKFAMCVTDLFFRNDYSIGLRVIHDFSNFTFNHFKKYAAKISIYSKMYQEAYFCRIIGVEYINLPPFVDILMQAGRALITPKIFKRITIHKNLDSLYKNISKDYLPKDYGGNQESVSYYLQKWDEEYANNLKYFNELLKQVSNENLRIGAIKYNDIFGTNGTFKTLNLD